MEKLLELNLIRNRMNIIETRRKYARYSRIFFVFAVVVFLVITFNFIRDTNKDLYLKKEFSILETDIADKRKAYNVEASEKQWREYTWKLKTVNSMLNDRSLWGNRLKELSNILPAGICISKIEISDEQIKPRYYVKFMLAQSEEKGFKQADGYINAVEKSKYFGKGVKLLSHDKTVLQNKEIEQFQILLSTSPLSKPS